MKQFFKNLKLAVLPVLMLTANLAHAQTISGYVTDRETFLTIEGAVVVVSGSSENRYFEVKRDGYFYFELNPGAYTIACNKAGYQTYVMERINLSTNETKTIDIALIPLAPVEELPPAVKETEKSEPTGRKTSVRIPRERPASAKFVNNPLLGLGAGYQAGNIGGISGNLDISLSRLFGISPESPGSLLFLSFTGGYESKAYKSALFNDSDLAYDFSFVRAGVGVYKIFTVGNFFIMPRIAAGLEQATPKTENVHELVDDGYIRVMNVQPSFSLGYAFTSSLVFDVTAAYYAMMKECTNSDNKILAIRDPDTDSWTPWSYSGDFYSGRKGFALLIGLKLYL